MCRWRVVAGRDADAPDDLINKIEPGLIIIIMITLRFTTAVALLIIVIVIVGIYYSTHVLVSWSPENHETIRIRETLHRTYSGHRWPQSATWRTPNGLYNGTLLDDGSILARRDRLLGLESWPVLWHAHLRRMPAEQKVHRMETMRNMALGRYVVASLEHVTRQGDVRALSPISMHLSFRIQGRHDPRKCGDWIVYSRSVSILNRGVVVCRINHDSKDPELETVEHVLEWSRSTTNEKNWVPFLMDYDNGREGPPHLAYTLDPHIILAVASMNSDSNVWTMKQVASTSVPLEWRRSVFGDLKLRGGTAAIHRSDTCEFVAVGHTHRYDAFFYAFSDRSPWAWTRATRPFHWLESTDIVFPSGLIHDDQGTGVWVSSGMDDEYTAIHHVLWAWLDSQWVPISHRDSQ